MDFFARIQSSLGRNVGKNVGSVKRALRRVLGKQLVKFETLQTVLCEIETAINKRPLSYISDEPDDIKPLRPIDFVSGCPFDHGNAEQLRNGIKHKNHFISKLWTRWKREYLMELRAWNQRRTSGSGIP